MKITSEQAEIYRKLLVEKYHCRIIRGTEKGETKWEAIALDKEEIAARFEGTKETSDIIFLPFDTIHISWDKILNEKKILNEEKKPGNCSYCGFETNELESCYDGDYKCKFCTLILAYKEEQVYPILKAISYLHNSIIEEIRKK